METAAVRLIPLDRGGINNYYGCFVETLLKKGRRGRTRSKRRKIAIVLEGNQKNLVNFPYKTPNGVLYKT